MLSSHGDFTVFWKLAGGASVGSWANRVLKRLTIFFLCLLLENLEGSLEYYSPHA